MTKTEQNRVVAWRLKLIREASELPRDVAQTCRHFGLSRTNYESSAERQTLIAQAMVERLSLISGSTFGTYLNWLFSPTKICHFGHPEPLSAIDTWGSMKALKTTFPLGTTLPMPRPMGTL